MCSLLGSCVVLLALLLDGGQHYDGTGGRSPDVFRDCPCIPGGGYRSSPSVDERVRLSLLGDGYGSSLLGRITCTLSVFSFENPSPPRTHITWQFSMNEHFTIRPSPQLIAIPDVLLCCKCSRYIIKPAMPRKSKYMFIIMLPLMSGIESNPGPVSPSSQQLQLGLVNARSIVNKAALIHDAIHDASCRFRFSFIFLRSLLLLYKYIINL